MGLLVSYNMLVNILYNMICMLANAQLHATSNSHSFDSFFIYITMGQANFWVLRIKRMSKEDLVSDPWDFCSLDSVAILSPCLWKPSGSFANPSDLISLRGKWVVSPTTSWVLCSSLGPRGAMWPIEYWVLFFQPGSGSPEMDLSSRDITLNCTQNYSFPRNSDFRPIMCTLFALRMTWSSISA